jgi:Reverse transcriptase (RNA-dependent DNA polymerase).
MDVYEHQQPTVSRKRAREEGTQDESRRPGSASALQGPKGEYSLRFSHDGSPESNGFYTGLLPVHACIVASASIGSASNGGASPWGDHASIPTGPKGPVFDSSTYGFFQKPATLVFTDFERAIRSKGRLDTLVESLKLAKEAGSFPPSSAFPFWQGLGKLPPLNISTSLLDNDEVAAKMMGLTTKFKEDALDLYLEQSTAVLERVKVTSKVSNALLVYDAKCEGIITSLIRENEDLQRSSFDNLAGATRTKLESTCNGFLLSILSAERRRVDEAKEAELNDARTRDDLEAAMKNGSIASTVRELVEDEVSRRLLSSRANDPSVASSSTSSSFSAPSLKAKRVVQRGALDTRSKGGNPPQQPRAPSSSSNSAKGRAHALPVVRAKSTTKGRGGGRSSNAENPSSSNHSRLKNSLHGFSSSNTHTGNKKNKVSPSRSSCHVVASRAYSSPSSSLSLASPADRVRKLVGDSTPLWLDTLVYNHAVHDMTNTQSLSREVRRALGLNYKFILRTRLFPLSVADVQWEDFARRLRWRFQFRENRDTSFVKKFWIPNPKAKPKKMSSKLEVALARARALFDIKIQQAASVPPPLPNLGPKALLALKTAFDDPTTMVLPTDKNLGLCVVDTEWYRTQARKHLEDVNTYSICDYYPPMGVRELQSLVEALDSTAELSKQERRWLTPSDDPLVLEKIPRLKILPKIHKLPVSSRPIVPTFGTLLSNASIWVDHQLQSLLPLFPWVLPDSKTLCRELMEVKLNPGKRYWLVSGDVVSMYPNIPMDVGIQRIALLLKTDLPPFRGGVRPRMVKDRASLTIALLRLVLTRNFVEFEGKVYRQKSGTAMGTALAPCYANLFMASFEKDLLPELNGIVLYRRYIDDVFAIIEGDDDRNVLEFQRRMGGLHPSLKFTWESSRHQLPFLDVHILLKPSGGLTLAGGAQIETEVYQKVLNSYLYIPWSSYHPVFVKRSFVKGELIRYVRLSSEVSSFRTVRSLFWFRLRARGYPGRWLRAIFLEVKWSKVRARSLRSSPSPRGRRQASTSLQGLLQSLMGPDGLRSYLEGSSTRV